MAHVFYLAPNPSFLAPSSSLTRRLMSQLNDQLAAYHQQHVLRFWDTLDAAERKSLQSQLAAIDLEELAHLAKGEQGSEDWAALAARAEAPPAVRLAGPRPFPIEEATARGEAALAAGKLAVILVAGGQGTRLGFDHPKGMYPIGPVSQAPLFEILIQKILARARRYGTRIPLYLMTSPATHDETVRFLQEHDRFGLPTDDLHIFCQGTMPAVDAATGKLLLASRGSLALSPDGHGGTLAALVKSGSLDKIRRRGIEQIFYTQIDNPLVSMCDPALIGYHLLAESEMSTQVIAKLTSRDKTGNVVLIDGKLRIIEYSDLNPLPDAIVERRSADGNPIFWAGNTANHVFDVAFLTRVAAIADSLPFHIVRKVVPHLDESGELVEPSEPNAIKFERFIFDLLPAARQGIVVEIDGEREFAPVKNASGEPRNSPETTRAQMVSLHREWLTSAGVQVAKGVQVEISPLFAQSADELAARVAAGMTVTADRHFC